MIRIRPGRSWRHNPGYLDELRALTAPKARAYSFAGILDVVGLEVDGVDIAAGVGEAPVLHTVDELTQALLHLGEGAGAAQATVGPGPTEVVLEPRGADVLLTLCTLRPPARVLAGGLLVDGRRLRAAALQAARAILSDVLDIAPALSEARLLRRLSRACTQLMRAPRREPAAWPGEAASATAGFVVRGGKARLVCEVQVPPEAAARLADAAAVPFAALAPLLGRGTVALRLPGAPALVLEGAPYLLLRDLVREAEALVQAWEEGDRTHALRLGPQQLVCDLTRDEVRVPSFSDPVRASAVQLASALLQAARSFADRALELGQGGAPAQRPEGPLGDLRGAADALLAHARDLSSGDLRRAPEAVPAPAPRASAAAQAPLTGGRLRRLVFREAFHAQLDPETSALSFCAGAHGAVLLAQAGARLHARDAASGRALWPRELLRSAPEAPLVRAGGDLFVEVRDKGAAVLERIDAETGAPRFRRRMRGAAALLFQAGDGVVRLVAEGTAASWALVAGEGRVALRGSLPEAPRTAVRSGEALVFCLPSGMLVGRSALDGSPLFRRRAGDALEAALLHGAHLVCLVRAGKAHQLCAFDAATGVPAWEHALPGPADAASLTSFDDCIALLCNGGVSVVRAHDGAPRFFAGLPWAGAAFLAAADELDDARPPRKGARGAGLFATGPGGAAVRLDARGALSWSVEASGASAAHPPLAARGVVLVVRDAEAVLYDAAEGLTLARLGMPEGRAAALAPDLTVALLHPEGRLALHRLASHLSVVA